MNSGHRKHTQEVKPFAILVVVGLDFWLLLLLGRSKRMVRERYEIEYDYRALNNLEVDTSPPVVLVQYESKEASEQRRCCCGCCGDRCHKRHNLVR